MHDDHNRITEATSADGTVASTYDNTNQLTGAQSDNADVEDESYTYDDNGNRTNPGYVTGVNNQLTSDGVYTYTYDNEGNRLTRTDAEGYIYGEDPITHEKYTQAKIGQFSLDLVDNLMFLFRIVDKGGGGGRSAPRGVHPTRAVPEEVAFSQRTVDANVTQYVDDMANGRWDWSRSRPINVMRQGDRYVTFDNRRLMAAREAKLSEIPINVVDPKAIRPGTKMTWEEAFRRRFNDPSNKRARGVVPDFGLLELPTIAPAKK